MGSATLSAEQQEFQEYARSWLAENGPPTPPERMPITPLEVMTTGQRDYLQAWQHKCYEAGLVGADYPTEYGGGGREEHRHAGKDANRAQRGGAEEQQRARGPLRVVDLYYIAHNKRREELRVEDQVVVEVDRAKAIALAISELDESDDDESDDDTSAFPGHHREHLWFDSDGEQLASRDDDADPTGVEVHIEYRPEAGLVTFRVGDGPPVTLSGFGAPLRLKPWAYLMYEQDCVAFEQPYIEYSNE